MCSGGELAQHPRDVVVDVLVMCRVLDRQGGCRQVLGVVVVDEIAGKCRVAGMYSPSK